MQTTTDPQVPAFLAGGGAAARMRRVLAGFPDAPAISLPDAYNPKRTEALTLAQIPPPRPAYLRPVPIPHDAADWLAEADAAYLAQVDQAEDQAPADVRPVWRDALIVLVAAALILLLLRWMGSAAPPVSFSPDPAAAPAAEPAAAGPAAGATGGHLAAAVLLVPPALVTATPQAAPLAPAAPLVLSSPADWTPAPVPTPLAAVVPGVAPPVALVIARPVSAGDVGEAPPPVASEGEEAAPLAQVPTFDDPAIRSGGSIGGGPKVGINDGATWVQLLPSPTPAPPPARPTFDDPGIISGGSIGGP